MDTNLLERSSVLAESEEKLASLLHEVKNPLAIALSALQLLEYKLQSDVPSLYENDYRRFMTIATRNINVSLRMTSNLVDVVRIKQELFSLEPEEANLVVLLREIRDNVIPYAQIHGICVQFECAKTEIMCMCDVQYISRAIMNVVQNSIKAVESVTGRIVISLQETEQDVTITVADNGCGIEEDQISHIFEKYYSALRSDREVSGFGLGLYLVKSFVTQHGGSVSVTSKVQEGTTFTITLPKYPKFLAEDAMLLRANKISYVHDWVAAQAFTEFSEFSNQPLRKH